ncbi:Gfo/Idh/MocA family oxidoreductase [soil metagenome]
MLKAGVIGAGVFGANHARKYAGLYGVDLIGVYDPDASVASALAGVLGVQAFTELADMLAAVDVVTVASPAIYHAGGVLAALAAGRHCYVEKPLATSLDDADKILSLAAAKGVVVAVGHQERVVSQAMGLFDIPEQPLRLEAVRMGTPSTRSLDVSVTLDLMVHDIDLALTLAASEPIAVEGEGDDDAATAEATFENGFIAQFAVSRIAPARDRRMRIVYPSGEVAIDFLARTFENSTPFALNANFADTPAGKDPLGVSVQGFLDAVEGRAPRPVVTAEEAARALDLALAVEQALDN